MDTLKTRTGFAEICRNPYGQGANIDKFILSKNGHLYLSYLKRNNKANDNQVNDQSEYTINNNKESTHDGKRKLQQVNSNIVSTDTTHSKISLVYKKSTNFPFANKQQHSPTEILNIDDKITSTCSSSLATGYVDIVKNVPSMTLTNLTIQDQLISQEMMLPKTHTKDMTQTIVPNKRGTQVSQKPQPIVSYVPKYMYWCEIIIILERTSLLVTKKNMIIAVLLTVQSILIQFQNRRIL
jgi:hypothetical protein